MRFFADTVIRKQYGHRAVVLETVAGVPGMVAGMWTHLTSKDCVNYRVDFLAPTPLMRFESKGNCAGTIESIAQSEVCSSICSVTFPVDISCSPVAFTRIDWTREPSRLGQFLNV